MPINPYQLEFLKNTDILENVEDGYSGAILYKIIRNHKNILKIMNETFTKQNIIKLQEILKIYETLNINSLSIVDYGKIEKYDKYYIVYNFIDGTNARCFYNDENFSLKEIREFGKIIGKESLALKNFQNYNKDLFEKDDIPSLAKDISNHFFDSLNHTNSSEALYDLFSKNELYDYNEKLQEYANIFKTISPNLIHGDIKRANIMMDSKKHYLVDCETMRISYDIMNFEHQMTWALMKGNNREKEFLKGFFDGLYTNKRPQDFNEQVLFILIYNFFQASFHKNETCPLNIVLEYWKKCRAVFDEINTMDLKNNFII